MSDSLSVGDIGADDSLLNVGNTKDGDGSLVTKFKEVSQEYYDNLKSCTPAYVYVFVATLTLAYFIYTKKSYRRPGTILFSAAFIGVVGWALTRICKSYNEVAWVITAFAVLSSVGAFWHGSKGNPEDDQEDTFCANC